MRLKKTFLAGLTAIALFAGFAAFSTNSEASSDQLAADYSDKYFTIDSVTVTEQDMNADDHLALKDKYSALWTESDPDFHGYYLSVDELVTIGQTIWKIIQENKPVVNLSTQKVSVLPKDQVNWMAMENWQGPIIKSYKLVAKNLYGVEVINLDYRLVFNYGGSWEGKGQYLANVTVVPETVDVSWGFALDANVEIGDILNAGTRKNPVPMATVDVKWNMKSPLKQINGTHSFYVKGNGEVAQPPMN